MNGTSPLVVRDAAVRLGGRTIWSDVTVEVGAGEFVAVLGPNGVGKSTLLKVVLGLLPLAAGEVLVCGREPGRGSSQVGYLPQRRGFDESTRVRGVDIVRLGLDGTRLGVPLPARFSARARVASRRVDELVELVGAAGFADHPIGALSGGEQQRLLIAQALARRPALLLLDEPLDSLDLANQVAVSGLLADICRTEGVAVVIVAHDLNPIITYLDRVVYLANGSAVTGPPREVVTSGTLSELYGTPIEVLEASDGRLVVVGQPEAASYHPALHAHHH
ncbi:MAG TPA: ATP-binding cassette domain-containing protein [Acidimicrobiia bacterium]|nr:ATP-binding cassette domain-containing protein [Acidimicrobiia bacterium]